MLAVVMVTTTTLTSSSDLVVSMLSLLKWSYFYLLQSGGIVTSHQSFHVYNVDTKYHNIPVKVEGVDGIMAAYASALHNVALAGPTLFGPVINMATEIAGQSLSHDDRSKYFVLLIITDGVLTDLQETKDALVRASDLPLSILIVGVGGADFTQMESDPMAVVYVKKREGTLEEIEHTEVIMNSLNPAWIVKEGVLNHFKLQFWRGMESRPKIQGLVMQRISQTQEIVLDEEFTYEEVWETISSCDGNKAPGRPKRFLVAMATRLQVRTA
ncbi:hypothetical protein Dsin_023866 [Dipteronia sinensis]|uniref:Copine C-terminal domain-containing protein n=1 Tax=Dipteronia sinensis TaxID=43782 RepID=A0AAE0A5P2_9ROSI|nr:hypothetical protein Dsin_023866 [Dipteronia sinensis]